MPSIENNLSSNNIIVSNDIQELISHNPHWIIRKGNAILFALLILLILFTWFIKYPDIIKGSLKLSAINAPVLLVSKTEGKLQKLLVSNEQEVVNGQVLAFMQSTANHQQVLNLLGVIDLIEPGIEKDSLEIILSNPFPVFNNLGELQSSYQEFQSNLKETWQVLANGYYQQKKKMLQKDLYYLSAIRENILKQQRLVRQDYELQQKEYIANQLLAKDKVIAPIELDQNKSKVLLKEQGLEQMSAQFINNSIIEQNKKKEIMELKKYITDQQQKFNSALFILKSKVDEWVQKYVVIAPETGKVLFTSFLQENQQTVNGQELFFIEPKQSTYYGQMMAPQNGLGKIKKGQKVLIRLESYPSNEFGYLAGSVSYISNMPSAKDSFLIKVDLPEGLHTNYYKTIFFRNNLLAEAEVMTDNRRLIDRFLSRLRGISKR